MTTPTRPVLRYHGGKWRLAPWIISHFPPHKIYTESFGGAASVLLRKPRAYAEIYNDLDREIVNLFSVLRHPEHSQQLIRSIELTPYARQEFEQTYQPTDDPLEQARRTVLRSMAGYSSVGATGKWKTGFRGNATRTGTHPATDWRNLPESLDLIVDRLRGVIIENSPAQEVIARYDGPSTLHYVDPPYPSGTRYYRWADQAYQHEMSNDDHRQLADVLYRCAGAVIISGYACDLYDNELYPDWQRIERQTYADGARHRTEVLWLSPNVQSHQLNLI